MFCAISGEIPKDPVVSVKTGVLFERGLIEKYLKIDSNSDLCPITSTPLTLNDLLPIKLSSGTASRPKLPLAENSSIPGLLNTFQNEWDEMMLETFTLKQHLDATRKELSHALFQHEAACRIIARLTRERDEANHMIHTLQTTTGVANNGSSSNKAADTNNEMEVEEKGKAAEATGLGESVLKEVNDKCKELTVTRKGRKPDEKVTSKDAMKTLSESNSFTPHKADARSGGVTCVSVAGNTALTGGMDKVAIVSDLSSGKVISKAAGHSKKINAVQFHPFNFEKFVTASADKSVKIWSSSDSSKCTESWEFKDHDAEVANISIHPTGNFLLSVAASSSWYFLDIAQGKCLLHKDTAEDYKFSDCAFHPDGLILATGSDTGVLKLWDIRQQVNVLTCAEHKGSINSIAFSENGYLAATGSTDGSVKIWDLRKQTCTKTFETGSSSVSSVAFDYSGVYLAIGGGGDKGCDVQVKVVKDWSQSVLLSQATSKPVTGVAWTDYAHSLVTSALDRTVKVYQPSA